MKESLISIETAKLAKEKGFDIPVIWGFQNENSNSLYVKSFEEPHCYNKRGYYSAPTQTLLQKWLREKYDIWVLPIRNLPYPHNSWIANIEYQRKDPQNKKYKVKHEIYPNEYRGVEKSGTYEDVLEAGLLEALKIL